jgi:hypothetical protein
MAQLPVSFTVDGSGHLIASVTGAGNGGVENGLLLQSSSFSSSGSVDLNLGAAVQSVSSFKFYLGSDTAGFVVSIGAAQTICVLPATDEMVATGPTPDDPSVVSRFINGISQTNVTAALTGALESWIEANATGIPVLILVGLVSGGTAFFLASLGQAGDFLELFVEKILAQEVADGILTDSEAGAVKIWAKAGDGVLQLPTILTGENTVTRVMSGIAADVNFESESDIAKLGVSIASNGVSKYVLALKALKK